MISKAFEECPIMEIHESDRFMIELQKKDPEAAKNLLKGKLNEARIRNANTIVKSERGKLLFGVVS